MICQGVAQRFTSAWIGLRGCWLSLYTDSNGFCCGSNTSSCFRSGFDRGLPGRDYFVWAAVSQWEGSECAIAAELLFSGPDDSWWAIALSIVSAETSTLTIISIPGVAFAGDFGFLQIVIGYMLGRIVVAMIFLPKYFQGQMLTAYQLIDRRFGHTLHKVTAGLFLLTRAAAEGVRVFAVSIVVGIAIGTRDVLSIAIISALTLLYTFARWDGGCDLDGCCADGDLYWRTFVAIYTLGAHVPGGWSQIHEVASAAGKFHLFNFAFNLTQSYTFWAGVLGGDVFDDGFAWHGSVDGAADAGGAESAGVAAGAAVEWWRDLFAVHAFSFDWCGALCFLWTSSDGVCFG